MLSSLAFWCFGAAALASILIGLLYALMPRIMPYHEKALETDWNAIDPKYQLLLRALLNGGGWFGLSCGLFMMVLLLIPFRAGEVWAGYAIGVIGLVGMGPLAWIVYKVKTQTQGNPPLFVMVIVNALMIGGLLSLILSQFAS